MEARESYIPTLAGLIDGVACILSLQFGRMKVH